MDQRSAISLRRAAAASCSTPAPARMVIRLLAAFLSASRLSAVSAASMLSRHMREEAGDRDVVGRAFADERVMREREVDRPARLRPHGGERVAEPVVQVLGRRHRLGQARERGHDGGVVERRLARVLKRAAIFQVEGHLAGHHQHRRAVGLGGGNGGCHVAAAGAADPERRAEAAAGAGIAVGHVDRAALVRRDHRRELALARQRRKERIDQSAGHHEQVTEAFSDEGAEDVVGAENRAGRGGGCHDGGC